MRFRLFGDLDCPDWILAEINSMARMTSIKMKMLASLIAKSILTGDLDFEKAKKLTADAKFDASDTKACVAALSHVLRSASRHGVDEEALSNELQQLGLPREHAAAVCKVHLEHGPAVTDKLAVDSLRLSRLESVQWRVDMVVDSSQRRTSDTLDDALDDPVPEVQLGLVTRDPAGKGPTQHLLSMTPTQLAMLIAEMKKATSILDSLE